MNLYAYVVGDPVNWTDPMGLFARKIACAAAVQNAITTCGSSFSDAYDNLLEDVKNCEDYYSPCLWGDRPENQCEPVQNCFGKANGLSCVRTECACDEKPWQDLKKDTMTPKCKNAIDTVIKYCYPKPGGFKGKIPIPL